MIRGGQAIRMGLRAASRNPELAFVRALLELMGSVMTSLPVLFAGILIWRAVAGEPALSGLLHAVHAISRLGLPVLGAIASAAVISWALSVGFWAGALPVLAVDAEMGARPPPGIFLRLAFSGFARVAGSSAIASGLSLFVAITLFIALMLGIPIFFATPSIGLAIAVAALLTCSLVTSVLVDLLGSLMVIRSAVLGDGIAASFGRAVQLFAERIWPALGIAFVFMILELMCATALGALLGPALADVPMTFDGQLLALAPRIAMTIASTVLLAWIEIARQGSLAALAADAEGLITLPLEPPPPRRTVQRRTVQAWELRPPPLAVQPRSRPEPARAPEQVPEQVIEALPIAEAPEPVIEALPIDPTGPGQDHR